MEGDSALATAREHARAGRYREAAALLEGLLRTEPHRVEALILLGKVEHYRGHGTRSRRLFETALSYEPSNLSAYFGIEHYRARRRTAALVSCTLALASVVAATGAFSIRRNAAVQREANRGVTAAVERLSSSLGDLARENDEAHEAAARGTRDTARELAEISAEVAEIAAAVARLRGENADLRKRLDELRELVLRVRAPDPAEGAAVRFLVPREIRARSSGGARGRRAQ